MSWVLFGGFKWRVLRAKYRHLVYVGISFWWSIFMLIKLVLATKKIHVIFWTTFPPQRHSWISLLDSNELTWVWCKRNHNGPSKSYIGLNMQGSANCHKKHTHKHSTSQITKQTNQRFTKAHYYLYYMPLNCQQLAGCNVIFWTWWHAWPLFSATLWD